MKIILQIMQENDSESAQKAAGEQDRLRLFLKSAEHGAQRLLQFFQNGEALVDRTVKLSFFLSER